MAGLKCASVLLLMATMVVFAMVVGQTSAATTPFPSNACFMDCIAKNEAAFRRAGKSRPDLVAYCSKVCYGKHYCMVGCKSSRFSALSTNPAAAEAMNGFVDGACSDICDANKYGNAAFPSK